MNNQLKNYFFIFMFACIVSLSGFILGFDVGVIAGGKEQITRHFTLSDSQWSIIASLTVWGSLLTIPFSGRLTDRIGVKNMLIIAALGFILGLTLILKTDTLVNLILGRVILGICIGISSFCAPLFIAEIAPTNIRGSFVLLNNIAITGGQAFSVLVGFWVHDMSPDSWRIILWIQLIASVCFFLGILFIPYAKKSYQSQKISYLNELFSKKNFPVLILGISLGLFQQLIGISAILYYGPVIFQALGSQSIKNGIFATFIIGMINLIFTVITAFLVDYLGRRKLLLYGTFLAAGSLFMIVFSYHAGLSEKILLYFMMLYMMGYCISLGSVFWVVIAEIYPLHIRGSAMGLATCFQMAGNLMITITFLKLMHIFGITEVLSLFGIFGLFAFLFIYFFVPETKGVPLEIIEENLNRNLKMRNLGRI